MTSVTLDIVLLLPEGPRAAALATSDVLARRMRTADSASEFRLGEPYPGDSHGSCEPHVSLFMLRVNRPEIAEVVEAVGGVATSISPLRAVGDEYRYNPNGAPELYFEKTRAWAELQTAVVRAVEPLRRGRLRDLDPAGVRIADLLADLPATDPRRQQLVQYGYDEITDGSGVRDRFNPHVTLAWPRDPELRVRMDELPPPEAFTAELADLAVYGMGPHGSCTTNHGIFRLG